MSAREQREEPGKTPWSLQQDSEGHFPDLTNYAELQAT